MLFIDTGWIVFDSLFDIFSFLVSNVAGFFIHPNSRGVKDFLVLGIGCEYLASMDQLGHWMLLANMDSGSSIYITYSTVAYILVAYSSIQ